MRSLSLFGSGVLQEQVCCSRGQTPQLSVVLHNRRLHVWPCATLHGLLIQLSQGDLKRNSKDLGESSGVTKSEHN